MKAMDECSSKDLVALSGFDGKQKRKSSVIRKAYLIRALSDTNMAVTEM